MALFCIHSLAITFVIGQLQTAQDPHQVVNLTSCVSPARFKVLLQTQTRKESQDQMSAQNPIPANATPAVMRAWVEDFAGHLPVAENVQIERVNCGPCEGDLILPAGGDASRLIIFYHG